MRPCRMVLVIVAALATVAVPAVGSSDAVSSESHRITEVTGTCTLEPATSLGVFDVESRVFQYRDVPITATRLAFTDPRLEGRLSSDWSFDIDSSGVQPVPAWGTIRIESRGADLIRVLEEAGAEAVAGRFGLGGATRGAWEGTFSGIRDADGEPMMVRTVLFGEAAYDGLCATLDVTVPGFGTGDVWMFDGVIHPVPASS